MFLLILELFGMRVGSLSTLICWYLCVLPVLHRPDVVDIGVTTIQKNMLYAKVTIEFDHF